MPPIHLAVRHILRSELLWGLAFHHESRTFVRAGNQGVPAYTIRSRLGLSTSDARRLARRGPDGAFVPLEHQARSRWDRGKIHVGIALVEQVLKSGPPVAYALQAAISALHIQATEFICTDWAQIVALYDLL